MINTTEYRDKYRCEIFELWKFGFSTGIENILQQAKLFTAGSQNTAGQQDIQQVEICKAVQNTTTKIPTTPLAYRLRLHQTIN